jgi:GAF domain-containing protein
MNQLDSLSHFERDKLRASDEQLRGYRELQTLQDINRTILDSLDLKIMMQGILEKASDIGGFDIGMICFVTAARQTLEPIAHRGFHDPENLTRYREHMKERSTAGIVDRVIATREIRVVDLQTTKGVRSFRREDVRSLVIVPIRTDQDALGILYLGSRKSRDFEPGQIRLLEAIGTQTGIAVQKIRLFEAAEGRAREQEALNVIAMATSQSLDLNELFEIAADKTVEVTGRQRINFRLKDPLSGKVHIVAYRGFSEKEIEALRLISPHPMSEQVFASGNPLVINNRADDELPGLLALTQSVAWIPVKANARVVGVLGISDDQSRPFSTSEVELLRAIGNVIGVAVENARLFDQTKRNLEGIRALHQIGTAMTSTLDLHEMLDVFLAKVDRVLPYSASTVRLVNRTSGVLEAAACRNLDETKWKAEQRQGARGLPHRVLENKGPLIIGNVQADPRVRDSDFFRKHGLVSYLGLPLIVRDDILGVLSFYTREEHEFTGEEVEFLLTLAGQAAISIHNSQLYQQMKDQAVELEKSNQAKDDLLDAMARQTEELSRLNAGLQSEIAERARARAEIAAKNRDLETLLYVTSHDLREPLRAIENFSRMVHDRYKDRLDEKGQDFLRRVIQGGQRLNRLLDDILTLSRSQRMGAPVEEVEGETIVLEALKRLEGRISATNAQIRVAQDLHGLRVDKTWATQAVYNLIANALKFTREGEPPDVEIAPYHGRDAGAKVVGIVVRDRGPGVAPEHAQRIFQLFQRGVGRDVEGTGAGLAIVRQIAERHGGHAWVEPRKGGGSEFVVTFGGSKDLEGGQTSEY